MTNNPPIVLTVVLDAVGIETVNRYLDWNNNHGELSVAFPHLANLGFGNLLAERHHRFVPEAATLDVALAAQPASETADSTVGHRELNGYVDKDEFPLFMHGFERDYVKELEQRIGRPVLCNQRAGGADAIAQNHNEHVRTKGIVLYSSMCDPIMQIAADENIIPASELNRIGQVAYELAMQSGINITRVITRPYIDEGDHLPQDKRFTRTENRKDIVKPMPPGTKTFVDIARSNGTYTVSVGKCAGVVNIEGGWHEDKILSGQVPHQFDFMYTTERRKDKNPNSLRETLNALHEARLRDDSTYIMANFGDTDSLYGHKRMPGGCLRSLMAFDSALPLIQNALPPGAIMLITADHGMEDRGDYGYHERTAVPVLGIAGSGLIKDRMPLPTDPQSYAVVGQMAAEFLGFQREYLHRCNLRETLPELK